ncbi:MULTISPECIES: hypothetical protein [unclassified Stenotrophomonas]|uniref:hypothetical protein n=1 Tax=unclassified Stenotrophomonas TaxID=196198 RepID=UPI00259B030E|nr:MULTISPECIES: hypothetical protein [unclassified Stenotrophomonas]WNB79260.1 hypothetical protein Q9R16_15780 [Stenotrophomonas sp. 9]
MSTDAQTLQWITYQTFAIVAQAVVAVGTIIVAIWLGRKQSKEALMVAKNQLETQDKLAKQQHDATLELSHEQHKRTVELSHEQHIRTVELMRDEWKRADEQREAERLKERDSLLALLSNFSKALDALLFAVDNPETFNEAGQRVVQNGAISLATAIDNVKREGRFALQLLNEVGPVLSKTVTGVLVTARLNAAFAEAANASSNVDANYPARVATWAIKVSDEYEAATRLI